MRFRLGLILGFLIGYVLGAKAGKRRYHQIQSFVSKVLGSEPAQQLSAEMREAASKAGDVLEDKASEGVGEVANLVRSEESPNGGTARETNLPPA
jgi:hypothetical protein